MLMLLLLIERVSVILCVVVVERAGVISISGNRAISFTPTLLFLLQERYLTLHHSKKPHSIRSNKKFFLLFLSCCGVPDALLRGVLIILNLLLRHRTRKMSDDQIVWHGC